MMKRSTLAGVLLLLAACLPTKRPSGPTLPPAPTTYAIFVHVCDGAPCQPGDESNKHPGAAVTISGQAPQVADASGNVISTGLAAGTYHVCARDAGVVEACADIVRPRSDADGGQDVFLVLVRNVPPVLAVHRDGKLLLDSTGALWPYRGVTAFTLLKDVIGGRDVGPYLADRAAAGATVARVLTTMQIITSLPPEAYTDAQLGALMAAAHAQGLRLELVALADAQDWPLSKQQAQVQRVANAIAANGCLDLLEVANEPFKNSAPPVDVLRGVSIPPCVVTATGDYIIPDGATSFPVRSYLTYHSDRDPEWPRKAKDAQDIRDGFDWAGGGSFPGVHVPVVDDEPMGADEIDQPGKRSTNPDDFYWLGATASLMSAGATFHSTAGITTTAPGPVQAAAERSFFAGMSAIPPETQTWQYTRGGLSNNPLEHVDSPNEQGQPVANGALRTFCKIAGGAAWCVVIRPGPAWTAVARDGWHVVSSAGPRGSIVRLAR